MVESCTTSATLSYYERHENIAETCYWDLCMTYYRKLDWFTAAHEECLDVHD